jgi:hypothetical protein
VRFIISAPVHWSSAGKALDGKDWLFSIIFRFDLPVSSYMVKAGEGEEKE